MLKTKIVKASLAAVAVILLIAPLTDFAEQSHTVESPVEKPFAYALESQAGQRIQASGTSLTVTYQYDSLGRLINESYPANTVAYGYDAAGNRTQSSTQ